MTEDGRASIGDLSQKATRAIAWLRANFAKPLRMHKLADVGSALPNGARMELSADQL